MYVFDTSAEAYHFAFLALAKAGTVPDGRVLARAAPAITRQPGELHLLLTPTYALTLKTRDLGLPEAVSVVVPFGRRSVLLDEVAGAGAAVVHRLVALVMVVLLRQQLHRDGTCGDCGGLGSRMPRWKVTSGIL